MKVSIIVPVHNGELYIRDCLNSLLNQTIKSYEVLCIDDGSIDNSYKILQEMQKDNPDKIKVYRTPNNGVYKARRLGIEYASGKYVGFCDCDDTAESELYEQLVKAAEERNAEMAIAAYRRINVDDNTMKVEMSQYGNTVWKVSEHKRDLVYINTALWNKIILRETAKKHIEFRNPPRVAEDMMFLLNIYPQINRICFVDVPMYNYNMRNSSAMSFVKMNEVENICDCMLDTKKLMPDKTWEDIAGLFAYLHIGLSLLLRIETKQGKRYVNIIKRYFENIFAFSENCNLKYPLCKNIMIIKIIQLMYSTNLIYILPYTSCFIKKMIKW